MEELAEAIMKLINEKPYSPRKEEILAVLSSKKQTTKRHSMDDAPKDGRRIIIICKDGLSYPAYYGQAVDKDGDSTVDPGESDEAFPWVVFDPTGEAAAISEDEGVYWLEEQTPNYVSE